MKKRRIFAFITALAMTCGALPAVCAEDAEKSGFIASLGLANSDLSLQSWQSKVQIDEGQNTLKVTMPADNKGGKSTMNGLGMFVIDLSDCYFEVGEVSVDKVVIDGKDIALDGEKIIYGADDGTDNDNFRIELFSVFGETKDSPAFDAGNTTVTESAEVTFTVRRDGYSGGDKTVFGNVISGRKQFSDQPMNGYTISAKLSGDPEAQSYVGTSDDSFSLSLKRGIYDISFAGKGYVTKEFKGFKFGKRTRPEEFQDIELCKVGDVSGDNKINVTDVSATAGYVKQVRGFADDYQTKVADVNNDGSVNVTDISKIAAHVKNVKKIF